MLPFSRVVHAGVNSCLARILTALQQRGSGISRSQCLINSLAASRVLDAKPLVLTRYQLLMNSPLYVLDVAAREDTDHIVNIMGSDLTNESHKCDVNAFIYLIFDVPPLGMLVLSSKRDTGVLCQQRTIFLHRAERYVIGGR
jgi:hypothetical protein